MRSLVFVLMGLTLPLAFGQDMAEMQEKFEMMSALPFSNNPFFAKTVATSGQFDGNGTEGVAPSFGGYVCQWIGNLNCTDDFTFQCEGGGVVDCTGTCPGDEETLRTMMQMMQDPVLAEKFPMIAEMQNKSKQAGEGGGQDKFLEMLRGCGFEKLIALMNMASSGGFGGGEESDITHVDEDAVSGFGGDYSYEYYDYEEDEAEDEPDKVEPLEAEDKQEEIRIKDRKRSMNLSDPIENITIKHTTKPADMKDGPDSNVVNIVKGTPKPVNEHYRYPKDYQSKEEDKNSRKRRAALSELSMEVGVLRRSFKKAVQMVLAKKDSGESREKRSLHHHHSAKKLKHLDEDLAEELAHQMENMDIEVIRKIRAVTDEMKVDINGMMDMENEKCKVQNLTCVAFPTKKQCQGISFGGCISRIKIIYMILSPRVILFSLITLAGISLAALFVVYYWRNNNSTSGNQVEPQQVMSVEPAENEVPNANNS